MNTETLQNAQEWVVETCGTAELGDVKIASALGENPSVSLPDSLRNWADTHAAYQFLGNLEVSGKELIT